MRITDHCHVFEWQHVEVIDFVSAPSCLVTSVQSTSMSDRVQRYGKMCAFSRAGVNAGNGCPAPVVEEPTSEDTQMDCEAGERSTASSADNAVAPHPAALATSADLPARERTSSLDVQPATDVAPEACTSSQGVAAQPLGKLANVAADQAISSALIEAASAAEPRQPPLDAGIDTTMRSASGEQPPPDTAANEHLAALMDQRAAGAVHAWLPCVADTW